MTQSWAGSKALMIGPCPARYCLVGWKNVISQTGVKIERL
jgi:hypothetical protein